MDRIAVFNTIWDNIENIVLSRIRECLNKNISSDEEFNNVYQYAIRNFVCGNLIEGQWILGLKTTDESKASEFLQKLVNFKFRHIEYSQKYILIGYLIVFIVGITTSLLLINFTNLTLFKDILWGVFSMMVSSGILLPIFQKKQNYYLEESVAKYKLQLESHKESLTECLK